MSTAPLPDILNIEQAAQLLGVSVKTFHKVLHSEQVPARKIGREWKFSRQALIDWVGSGVSVDFYRGENGSDNGSDSGSDNGTDNDVIHPMGSSEKTREARRTAGWRLEMD